MKLSFLKRSFWLLIVVWMSTPSAGRPIAASAVGDLTFGSAGLHGGGHQNVTAVAAGSSTVLSGADVSGVNRSANLGLVYAPSNLGLTTLKVASLAYHPSVAGRLYAATGNEGRSGGFYRSNDDGRSWELLSEVPKFSGNHAPSNPAVPGNHPRSTGNLIAIDAASGMIWVGTFKDGVMRSTDGGRTWETLGLAGKYIRSIALDPANPDVLYAGAYNDGIYKTASAKGGGAFGKLIGSPAYPEELLVLSGTAFVAAGTAGIYKSTDGGANWKAINRSTIPVNGSTYWTAIAGYQNSAGKITLYVGCMKPVKVGGNPNYTTIFKSTNGGDGWAPVTGSSQIHHEILGTSERWFASKAHSSAMLDKSSMVVSHIAIDADEPETVFVAGSLGVWRTDDGGANWYPSVKNMGVTANSTVVADANTPGRVYLANTDFRFFYSTDYWGHLTRNRPSGSESMGTDVALDASRDPSTVYLSIGDRDTNSGGEVYSNPDPATTSSWTDEGLSSVAGGRRPLGVAVGRVGGQRVILAAVEASGIWRKAGSTWTKVDAIAMTGSQSAPPRARFQWAGSTVYLYDRASGVWRSNDDGLTWTMIWARPSNNSQVHTGFLATDPSDPGRLYISVGIDGVYRLEGAASGTVEGGQITPVKLGDFIRPGPIATYSGELWVTEGQTSKTSPRIAVSGDRGATFTEVGDSFYRSSAVEPSSLEVTATHIYVSLRHNGGIKASR